jgi:hypothetical protein
MKQPRSQPPKGAPEGTVWFGGPVDRCKVTLRVAGEGMDPGGITSQMKLEPTFALSPGRAIRASDGTVRRVDPVGRWHFTVDSDEVEELRRWPSDIVEDLIRVLFDRLPADPAFWKELAERYRVDLFCGLFLYRGNRGFCLSPEICKLLGERGIEIGFDIYCEAADGPAACAADPFASIDSIADMPDADLSSRIDETLNR